MKTSNLKQKKIKRRYFTQEEKEFIFKNRKEMFISEIAKILKRTDGTIRNFLSKKKLSFKRVSYDSRILTKKEEEVISLMAEGLTDKEIAEKLFLAETTIRTHKINIYSKCNATGSTARVKAVLYYLKERGLLCNLN